MGIKFQLLGSINEVAAEDWDNLWQTRYPFVQHRFLATLEDSGCTSDESGWLPQHLVGYADGKLAFAMPLYLKSHSWGEYVFDWSWAEAYHRNGLAYYPKLVNAIPFTPASGPRLALTEDAPTNTLEQAIGFLQHHCQEQGLSGVHSLFTGNLLASSCLTKGCNSVWVASFTGLIATSTVLRIFWRHSVRASAKTCAKSASKLLQPMSPYRD